jgi:hypothetical protein
MDGASLFWALCARDAIALAPGAWAAAVALTGSLLASLSEERPLAPAVDALRADTAALADRLSRDTEYGQRLRELQAADLRLAELRAQCASADAALAALGAEVAAAGEAEAPLRAESARLAAAHAGVAPAVARLDAECAAKREALARAQEIAEHFARENAALGARAREAEERLLRLRAREAELRALAARPARPVADCSAMLCPVPRGGGIAPLDGDALLDAAAQEDARQIDRLKSGSALRRHADSITCLAFSPTQPVLASGGEDTVVSLVRTDTAQPVAQLTESTASIMGVAFSPADQLLASASWDHAVRVYRVAPAGIALVYNCKDHTDCVYDAQFLSDGQFVSCSRDQTVRLFDVKRMAPVTTFTSSSRPLSISSLQGGSLVVTAHFDGCLRGWDFRARGAPIELKAHKGVAGFATGLPGTMQIVSYGSADGLLIAFDLRSRNMLGKVAHRMQVSREKIQLAIWGEHAVIGAQNGELCSYDLTTFKLKKAIQGSDAPVFCVAAKSNFGLAAGDQAGVLKFWSR